MVWNLTQTEEFLDGIKQQGHLELDYQSQLSQKNYCGGLAM